MESVASFFRAPSQIGFFGLCGFADNERVSAKSSSRLSSFTAACNRFRRSSEKWRAAAVASPCACVPGVSLVFTGRVGCTAVKADSALDDKCKTVVQIHVHFVTHEACYVQCFYEAIYRLLPAVLRKLLARRPCHWSPSL